ncbi:hypothetical protein KM043_011660 [Ampulex compressa]|nr:hypothetical protein KM043_011660 [Ampulex compressa]
MLILRMVAALSVCWTARGDLLDLYVQHMDEIMRTLPYGGRHHPKDITSRIRRGIDEEPVLKLGMFKKQRLDVDKDWYRQWKAKKRIVSYKNDGLDFPNKREQNLDPDQHEFLDDVTPIAAKDPEEIATVPEFPGNEDLDTISEAEVVDEESSRPTINVRHDLNSNRTENLEYEDFDEDSASLSENRTYEVREPVTESARQEEKSEVEERRFEVEAETDASPDFEIIEDSDKVPQKAFYPPTLKREPKLRNRRPKKYVPHLEKIRKDSREVKGFAKDEVLDNRPKRNARGPKFSRYEKLDENGDVVLEWDPSDDEVVTFRVTAKTLGYVGIGFNEKSHMKGADIVLAWVDDHTGAVNLLDSHGIEETNAAPVTDASQDVRVLEGSQNETHTSITFSRNWQTCDPQDHRLTGDTVRVLWALHESDPELNTAIWHGDRRGGRALRLKTAAPHSPPQQMQDLRHWDVKLNQFTVSDNMDTVYWCKIFKAPPLKEKYHMIGYTPLVEKANEDLVHHVILYECASTAPILGEHARIVGAPCYSPTMPREWESCLQPVLAWARGSKGEWLPEHVGIPIAEHREGSYYMLEVHYNNPSMKKVIDSSGVRLHLTPNLRPQEAGILVAGVAVSPLHLVPPRQKEYATAGYCTPHCTNTMFPDEGVNVVSVVLHSHLAGRRLSLKHIRQGKELPRIVEDNHFDFDYQQSHTLEKEVKILPGDELVAECVYGTLDRSRPTLGGYAASQEMCLAFVVHYPRTPLAACYSMTPVKDLFKTLGVHSFKGVTMDHLEKLFLTMGTDAVSLPATSPQQLPVYPATRPSEEIDEDLIREAETALKAMRDHTEERENDNVFARLIIEEPDEFRGRTLAEHILALPWTEELLARSIESSLYHGRHMTFCRKRDDKLALPADIQTFPNYTALPETNETSCSELREHQQLLGAPTKNTEFLREPRVSTRHRDRKYSNAYGAGSTEIFRMRRTRHVTLPVRSWRYIGLLIVSLACMTLGLVSRDREGRAGSLAGPELLHRAPHEMDACPNSNPFTELPISRTVHTHTTTILDEEQNTKVSRVSPPVPSMDRSIRRSRSLDRLSRIQTRDIRGRISLRNDRTFEARLNDRSSAQQSTPWRTETSRRTLDSAVRNRDEGRTSRRSSDPNIRLTRSSDSADSRLIVPNERRIVERREPTSVLRRNQREIIVRRVDRRSYPDEIRDRRSSRLSERRQSDDSDSREHRLDIRSRRANERRVNDVQRKEKRVETQERLSRQQRTDDLNRMDNRDNRNADGRRQTQIRYLTKPRTNSMDIRERSTRSLEKRDLNRLDRREIRDVDGQRLTQSRSASDSRTNALDTRERQHLLARDRSQRFAVLERRSRSLDRFTSSDRQREENREISVASRRENPENLHRLANERRALQTYNADRRDSNRLTNMRRASSMDRDARRTTADLYRNDNVNVRKDPQLTAADRRHSRYYLTTRDSRLAEERNAKTSNNRRYFERSLNNERQRQTQRYTSRLEVSRNSKSDERSTEVSIYREIRLSTDRRNSPLNSVVRKNPGSSSERSFIVEERDASGSNRRENLDRVQRITERISNDRRELSRSVDRKESTRREKSNRFALIGIRESRTYAKLGSRSTEREEERLSVLSRGRRFMEARRTVESRRFNARDTIQRRELGQRFDRSDSESRRMVRQQLAIDESSQRRDVRSLERERRFTDRVREERAVKNLRQVRVPPTVISRFDEKSIELPRKSSLSTIRDSAKSSAAHRELRSTRSSVQNRDNRNVNVELIRIHDNGRFHAAREVTARNTQRVNNSAVRMMLAKVPELLNEEGLLKYASSYEILRQALMVGLCTLYGLSIYNGKGTSFSDLIRRATRFVVS